MGFAYKNKPSQRCPVRRRLRARPKRNIATAGRAAQQPAPAFTHLKRRRRGARDAGTAAGSLDPYLPLSDSSPTLSDAAAEQQQHRSSKRKQPTQLAPVHLRPPTLVLGTAMAPAFHLLPRGALAVAAEGAAAHHRLLPARAPWLAEQGGTRKASNPGAATTAAP